MTTPLPKINLKTYTPKASDSSFTMMAYDPDTDTAIGILTDFGCTSLGPGHSVRMRAAPAPDEPSAETLAIFGPYLTPPQSNRVPAVVAKPVIKKLKAHK